MNRPLALMSALALLFCNLLTHADTTNEPAAENKPDWVDNAGVTFVDQPRFSGADRNRLWIIPMASAKYRDWFFVSVTDGIGFSDQISKSWAATAAIGPDLTSRHSHDDPRLHGMTNVHDAAAAIFTLNYEPGPVSIDTTLTERLGRTNQRGLTFVTEASVVVLGDENGAVSIGATGAWMDKTYADTFFSVTPTESAQSGLATYSAGAGIKQSGGFLQFYKPFAKDWIFLARFDIARLHGDAAKSPIVRRERENTSLFSLSRNF